MTTTQRKTMLERIEQHGRNLLAIFPEATERDPVKLCKKLRRLEAKAAEIGLRMCNGPQYAEGEADAATEAVLVKVNTLLQNRGCDTTARDRPRVPVFINRDPRGYALKIADGWMRDCQHELPLYKDWGGYGIIAPDFSE